MIKFNKDAFIIKFYSIITSHILNFCFCDRNGLFQICFFFSKATIIRSLSHLQLLAYYSRQAQDLKCVLRSESERVSASFNNLQALSPIDLNLTFTGIHKPNVIGVTLGVRILVVFLFVLFVF